MARIARGLTAIALAGALVAGCANQGQSTPTQTAQRSCGAFGPKATVGILGGAVAGAGIAAAASRGNGTAALIGALAGAVAGGLVGTSLDQEDCKQAQVALRQMETARTGSQIAWSNPQSGNRGTFTPTSDAQEVNGKTCRSYKRDIVLKDGQQTGGDTGVVCRTPDGDWQEVS